MALPSTPMLDDFSRPNESPLSRNGWANLNSAFTSFLTVTSNTCQNNDGQADAGSFLPTSYIDTEVWAVVGVGGTFAILSRVKDGGGSNTWDGIFASINSTAVRLFSFSNAVPTPITAQVTISATQPGDTIVLRSVGITHTIYRVSGNSVAQLLSGSTTVFPSGQIGLYISTGTNSISKFGGGAIDSVSPAVYPIGKVRH